MVASNGFDCARSRHGEIHSLRQRHVLCSIPEVLELLHDVVHEAVFRIVNGLQLAERICGLVGIACDRIAAVLRNERHDTFLYVLFCCTMADVRMNMEHSNGGKWKISSGDMAGVVGENRILSGFWQCSTDLIVLLGVDDDNLAVLATPLNGGAWWQSLSNILLLVEEHGCSGGCQSVGCWSIIVRISATVFEPEEASEHSECCTPELALR